MPDDVVGMLENAPNLREEGVGTLMVESTLFHEGTHFGNTMTREDGDPNGIYTESGVSFEKEVYRQDIKRRNVRQYWNKKNPLHRNPFGKLNRNSTILPQFNPKKSG